MTKKKDFVEKLLSKVELEHGMPERLEEGSLLEQGLYAVLQRRLDPKVARKAVENLRKAYEDWNELRVAQKQEIAGVMKIGARGLEAAKDVRSYLQEVFQRSHGLDLDFLRNDQEAIKRFAQTLPFIGNGLLHWMMWQGTPGEFPVTAGMMRVLDRIGIGTRISVVKKARAAMSPLVAENRRLEFAVKFGEVASRWCNAQKPVCQECVLVDDCKYGKKAFRDWRAQQERLESQRVREEARLELLRKKEEAKARREAARARKLAEAAAKKKEREAARKAKVHARKLEAAEKKSSALRAREEARKQREVERLRKKAAAEAARKKQQLAAERAKKKAEAEARKKAAAKKKSTKAGKKKVTKKKASSSRSSSKKAPARKAATKKKSSAKKTAAKKTSSTKPASRKASTKKKSRAKKPAARKTSSTKRPATRKKSTRPKSGRRSR